MHEFVDAPEIVLLPSGGAVNSTSKKKMFCMGIAVTVQLHKIFDGMPEVNIPGRFLTVNVVDGTRSNIVEFESFQVYVGQILS